MEENMYYTEEAIKQATSKLWENYPDEKVNNNKFIGNYQKREINTANYLNESLKRSTFINYIFENNKLYENAFVGSCFNNIDFLNCQVNGNGFVNCTFNNSNICCEENTYFSGNNYSQSNFIKCNIENIIFKNSSFLNALFLKSTINNCVFSSCTLEGIKINNTTLKNVDLGHVNVEFIELFKSSFENVSFPFYQAAYVIGIANCFDNDDAIYFKTQKKTITKAEYLRQINTLIPYYYGQEEYFPICNLQIIQGEISAAKETLLMGINKSIAKKDFRLIRYFCRLAQRFELLDEVITQKILKEMDLYITGKDLPIDNINNSLLYYGEIREMLLSGNSNSINLKIKVRTNICKKNRDGVKYVNELCNVLNEKLSRVELGQTGFRVALSNHSPFEIVIDVFCGIASVATISDFIWKIIDSIDKKKKESTYIQQYEEAAQDMFKMYTDARINLCKEQLMNTKDKYSNKKMNQYIEDITQQLKTDIDSFYDKDIIIFRKKNIK